MNDPDAPASNTARIRPPAPSTVGESARQILEMPEMSSGIYELTHRSDPDLWLEHIAAANEMMVKALHSRMPADPQFQRDELEIGGVHTYVLRPDRIADDPRSPLYIDIHGGGLVCGGGEAALARTLPPALERDMITWVPDYRMPPLHPYPAALDDLVAVYEKALAEREPQDIFIGGNSAGGNLAAALILRANDEGLPGPAALVLLTPEVDLTEAGDTFRTLLGIDNVLPSSLMETNLLYADGHDLRHPHLSPLFGDLECFPPTYLQSGTRDLFLSNTVLMHRKLRDAGIEAELHVGEAMPHGGFGGQTPEDQALEAEQNRFLDKHRRS